jgi:hypothetical protein
LTYTDIYNRDRGIGAKLKHNMEEAVDKKSETG